MSTIEGPFTYEALKPEDIEFIPLNKTESMNGHKLMEYYQEDQQLKHFLHIIRDSPVYPVIKDKNGVVLSLPPIINGDKSKITLDTKDIFIECTATDLTKAKMAVNIVCEAFSIYYSDQFSIEQVEVVESDGSSSLTPNISERSLACDMAYLNKLAGNFLNFLK